MSESFEKVLAIPLLAICCSGAEVPFGTPGDLRDVAAAIFQISLFSASLVAFGSYVDTRQKFVTRHSVLC